MSKTNLTIQRVHSIEMCVHDAHPWLDYLTTGFGFQLVAAGTGADVEETGVRRRYLRCGDAGLVLAEKVRAGSSAHRYLQQHPEGVWRVNFLVADIDAAAQTLVERHATPTESVRTDQVGEGEWRSMSIATPLGDVEFTFIQNTDPQGLMMPGLEPSGHFDPDQNPIGLRGVDHMTANMRTLMPTIAFFEHVLGFRRFWDVQFHTEGLRPGVGTGLKSVVMWDEESGIKFANNEPLPPRFSGSQVQLCVEANCGPGIHHFALEVGDILAAVDHCRRQGLEFLSTPEAYYAALPGRIGAQGITGVSQSIDDLRARGILLDGDKDGYLLQAFCKDRSDRFVRSEAGPICLELIQRCGATGFGEGNFRALFEAMSREQE